MKRLLQLGDQAKDKITGFQGTVIGKTVWLSGCVRLGLQSATLKDGLPTEAQWFDEAQLVAVEAPKLESATRETGGPMPTPARNADPRR